MINISYNFFLIYSFWCFRRSYKWF